MIKEYLLRQQKSPIENVGPDKYIDDIGLCRPIEQTVMQIAGSGNPKKVIAVEVPLPKDEFAKSIGKRYLPLNLTRHQANA